MRISRSESGLKDRWMGMISVITLNHSPTSINRYTGVTTGSLLTIGIALDGRSGSAVRAAN
jgi:hypothetical protein